MKTTLVLPSGFTVALLLVLLFGGCSWNDSPPPLHSTLRFERSGTDTGWATREYQSSTNVASSGDWQTNQVQGVGAAGYGAAGGIGTGSASGASAGGTAGRTSTASPSPSTGLSPMPTTSGLSGSTTATPNSLSTLGTSSSLPTLTNSAPAIGTSRTNSSGLPQ